VAFPLTSECCWIMPFQICLGNCAGERKVDSAFFMPMLWEIMWSMYSTNSRMCLTLIEWDKISFLLLIFDFHLLYYSYSMCWAEHSDHQNVPFISLRMICKTSIWCNQILIVKQQWRAVIITSRRIFPFVIFLVLQCS